MVAPNVVPASIRQIRQQKGGLLLVDKPSGPTSHDVVSWARRLFGIKRIGHTGTLDPLASGLLILLIGREWTKRQIEFLQLPKTYELTMKLGVVSDTYDATGQLTEITPTTAILETDLEKVISSFIGTAEQRVPAYSAVKVGGKKLYQLARKHTIAHEELPSRMVNIAELTILNYHWPECHLRVECSSGTYVRSLVHDLGQTLGVGATVTQLRRTAIGHITLDQATICPYLPRFSSATSSF